jgi:hypothetical protein
MAEVEVLLKTDLPWQLSQERFSVVSSWGVEELQSLVNTCLDTELTFNFSVKGRLLTGTLDE